jgi:ABC-2 type transport system ATP-binding protein
MCTAERGLFEDAGILDTLVYLGTLRGMSPGDARRAGRAWLERMDLADRMQAKIGTLSKGNQQKVQFAGAVLHRPALAVLDEPFGGLDPLNQEQFKGFVHELRQSGTAVLLSAHHLDLVERLCDRFHLIARGREVLSGTLEGMRRRVLSGAAELLTVVVRARDAGPGEALARRVGETLARVAATAERRVRDAGPDRVELDLALEAGTDLGPILSALAERASIERVEMRPLPLHEIYLRAVGDRHEQPVVAEEHHG